MWLFNYLWLTVKIAKNNHVHSNYVSFSMPLLSVNSTYHLEQLQNLWMAQALLLALPQLQCFHAPPHFLPYPHKSICVTTAQYVRQRPLLIIEK